MKFPLRPLHRRVLPPVAMAAALVAALATAPVAAADAGSFCRMLSAQEAGGAAETGMAVSDLGEATCGRSLGLGGVRALACRWPFPYRAEAARAAFERLVDDVATCPGATALPVEGGVNHPDSYALRRFSLGGGTVAVSLKDKAALRETYVFLRRETRGD